MRKRMELKILVHAPQIAMCLMDYFEKVMKYQCSMEARFRH